MNTSEEIKKAVRENYGTIAKSGRKAGAVMLCAKKFLLFGVDNSRKHQYGNRL